jgi:LuxR family transcriptional regulator, maltose regulon positive regulatory protein
MALKRHGGSGQSGKAARCGAPEDTPRSPAQGSRRRQFIGATANRTNLSRQEIAGELPVSLNTVNTHIRNIYAKLRATDRSSAVQQAGGLRLLGNGGAH